MDIDAALAEPTSRKTVAWLWRNRLANNPDGPLLRFGTRILSAREVDEYVAGVAGGLVAAGVGRDGYVGQFCVASEESVYQYLACSLLGIPIVPMNTSLRGPLLRYVLNDIRCRLLFCSVGLAERVAEIEESLPHLSLVVVSGQGAEEVRSSFSRVTVTDYESFCRPGSPLTASPAIDGRSINCVIYTSGTTGPSKGVLISNALAVNKALDFARICELGPSDTMYSPLPLFHETGLLKAFLGSVAAGCSVLLRERFSTSQFWQDVRTHGATAAVGFPTMQTWLLETPPSDDDRNHTLRRLLSLPNAAFAERFGVWPIASYGATEITSAFHVRPGEKFPPGTCGRASRDWEVRLVDDEGAEVAVGEVGEILLRPRRPGLIMSGYLNQPEATARALEDLWFHTGDLACKDSDGFFYFRGRKKDVIRRRGENISAWELERILSDHPDVDTAVALPVQRPDGDDDVWVVVVPKQGHALTPESVLAYCEQNMPDFMVPRYVDIRTTLPRTTATNRVEKHVLRSEGPSPTCFDAGERPRSRARADLAVLGKGTVS